MTSIDLSIVRNVGVNIVLSSQIFNAQHFVFYTIFCIVHSFNNTVLHCPRYFCLLLDIYMKEYSVFSLLSSLMQNHFSRVINGNLASSSG